MSQAPTPQTVERQIEDPDRFADANFPDFTPHRPERPAKSEGGIAYDLQAPYEPKGDQPQAIGELVAGVTGGEQDQVLLGVTGSGKTFTMAQVVAPPGRPALILTPNQTRPAPPDR